MPQKHPTCISPAEQPPHCCAQGLYLLLVTNKASNILEDLETLRLLSKVLPEYVLAPVDEENIGAAAFELLSAFDEVISLGYKENVTVGQVCGRLKTSGLVHAAS